MAKRNIANEILQGLNEIKAHREGKITLRTYEVEPKPLPKLEAAEIRAIRDALGVSQAVMAYGLRVSKRTLEGWEQGRSAPNKQAVALMLLAKKYPDTITRLESLTA